MSPNKPTLTKTTIEGQSFWTFTSTGIYDTAYDVRTPGEMANCLSTIATHEFGRKVNFHVGLMGADITLNKHKQMITVELPDSGVLSLEPITLKDSARDVSLRLKAIFRAYIAALESVETYEVNTDFIREYADSDLGS